MSEVKEYAGKGITVRFDAGRCIHAGECVRGLPQVFDPKRRPWIQPGDTDAALLAETAQRCPTGALTVSWPDGRAEVAPEACEARLTSDGPVMLRGRIEVCDGEGRCVTRETRMALCRCGQSKHMPYCDNSHAGSAFRDDGACAAGELSAVATGTVRVTPLPGGPAQCEGPLTLVDAFGEAVYSGHECWLCRCGASESKPFCDGSHKKVGFKG